MQARVDDALTRILTALFSVGVFDRKDYGNNIPKKRGRRPSEEGLTGSMEQFVRRARGGMTADNRYPFFQMCRFGKTSTSSR